MKNKTILNYEWDELIMLIQSTKVFKESKGHDTDDDLWRHNGDVFITEEALDELDITFSDDDDEDLDEEMFGARCNLYPTIRRLVCSDPDTDSVPMYEFMRGVTTYTIEDIENMRKKHIGE